MVAEATFLSAFQNVWVALCRLEVWVTVDVGKGSVVLDKSKTRV